MSTNWVPYLDTISEGAGGSYLGQLRFRYVKLTSDAGVAECVVRRIERLDIATSTWTPIAAYEYEKIGSQEFPGRIGDAGYNQLSDLDTYLYHDAGLVITRNASVLTSHGFQLGGNVVTDTAANQALSIDYSNTSSPVTFCGFTSTNRIVTNSSDQIGDGSSTGSDKSETLKSLWTTEMNGPRLYSRTDVCSDGSCSPGTEKWEWTCHEDEQVPNYERGYQDKRGNWSVWNRDAGSDRGQVAMLLGWEKHGATSLEGADALQTITYDNLFGDGGVPLVVRRRVASTSGSGEKTTTYQYDPNTNRLQSTIITGKTQTFSAGAFTQNVTKHLGTFYFITRPRSSMTTPDEFGRTLEQHGPCWVNSATSTDCDDGNSYPVTQWEYYSPSATNNRANKLKAVRRYPSATVSSLGTALEVTYDEYDSAGRPTRLKDPNQIVTAQTYTGAKLTSTVTNYGGTDPRTTAFTYENGELTATAYPDGRFEVYCYRENALSSGCTPDTSRPWTRRLQWKATASSATGATWSDRIRYEYWADGTVKKETHEATYPGGATEVRRVLQFARDAHRRLTMEKVGDGSASFTAWSRFDPTDNQTASSVGYNSPPSRCDDGAGNISKTCIAMAYDRMNRIESVAQYKSSSSSTPTRHCTSYDVQGNVVRVSQCEAASGTSCEANFTNLCLGSAYEYKFDDFGNLIESKLPNTTRCSAPDNCSSASKGYVRFTYDAQGNELVRQTNAQWRDGEWTAHAYDQMSRPLSSTGTNGSTSDVLWTREYDSTAAGSSCGPKTYQLGRLARERNARGQTVYAYNPWGEITNESRYRTTPDPSDCTLTGVDDKPSTSYSRDPNGRLVSVTYPHGRVVRFGYYSASERAHLVEKVQFDKWNGSTTTTTDIISGARWAFGQLVAYNVLFPLAGTSANVEYLLGDSASLTDWDQRETSDQTGRLRGVWVSDGGIGTGTGNIYRRTYAWTKDLVAASNTSWVGDPQGHQENYDDGTQNGYDQFGRLVHTVADGGASYSRRDYTYDSRGNRQSVHADGVSIADNYDYGPDLDPWVTYVPDILTNMYTLGNSDFGVGNYSNGHDVDGRVTWRSRVSDSTGYESRLFTFGYSRSANLGGDSSVFKTITINDYDGAGAPVYSYYYDPDGRRVLKQYPNTALSDEFFYFAAGNHLIEDRGVSSSTAFFNAPIDEYVWLGDRPVAVIRSKFNSSWQRQPDMTGSCDRMGEAGACGVYFPITDNIGKPVAVLDSNARVSAILEYDPFGMANRTTAVASTGYGYSSNQNTTLGTFTVHAGSNESTTFRANFYMVDTEEAYHTSGACSSSWTVYDYARLTDTAGASLTSDIGGHHKGPVRSAWLSLPTNKQFQLRFTSDAINCEPFTCCSVDDDWTYSGVSLESYEVRRYESGASWFSIPLRFPGQYHDEESDLFENWNRYYDPLTGRYLQPEPMHIFGKELNLPAYSYVSSNPVALIDPRGEFILQDDGCDHSLWETAHALAREWLRCDGEAVATCDACQEAQLTCGCDVCGKLRTNALPNATIDKTRKKPPKPGTKERDFYGWWMDADAIEQSIEEGGPIMPESYTFDFPVFLCRPSQVGRLANTLIHEAVHACTYTSQNPKFMKDATDKAGIADKCSSWGMSCLCTPKHSRPPDCDRK